MKKLNINKIYLKTKTKPKIKDFYQKNMIFIKKIFKTKVNFIISLKNWKFPYYL